MQVYRTHHWLCYQARGPSLDSVFHCLFPSYSFLPMQERGTSGNRQTMRFIWRWKPLVSTHSNCDCYGGLVCTHCQLVIWNTVHAYQLQVHLEEFTIHLLDLIAPTMEPGFGLPAAPGVPKRNHTPGTILAQYSPTSMLKWTLAFPTLHRLLPVPIHLDSVSRLHIFYNFYWFNESIFFRLMLSLSLLKTFEASNAQFWFFWQL